MVVLDAMPIASLQPRLSSMISRWLWRSRPALVSSDQITPLTRRSTRSDEMSHRSGSASSAPQDRLGEGVADDGDAVHPVALDGVEQFDRVEVAAERGDDPAGEHQVPHRVEERRCRA